MSEEGGGGRSEEEERERGRTPGAAFSQAGLDFLDLPRVPPVVSRRAVA